MNMYSPLVHILCSLVNKHGGSAMTDQSLSCVMLYTVIRSVISSFMISHFCLSPLENPPCPQNSNHIITPQPPTSLPVEFQKAISGADLGGGCRG